jgi:hypothetical protein
MRKIGNEGSERTSTRLLHLLMVWQLCTQAKETQRGNAQKKKNEKITMIDCGKTMHVEN